ncbi:hypothetical protein N9D23_00595 [Rubripirellula sp.]|nr:hypothetical protein [Rubripirellula sp.]
MKKDPSGSKWRKWDLHFHTPASFDYQNKSITDEEIVDGLKAANIAAVAITDHHTMDVDRIKNLQALGGEELTVFPGIELRSELGGSETVHFIGIFPENCDVETLWDKLKGKLDLTVHDVQTRGDDNIYVPFEPAATVIHELGGLITVHAGKKTNSIENIRNSEKFKMAFKKDIAQRHVDILEVKSTSDVASYREKVFPAIGFPLPVIVGSDNHNIRNYSLPTPCWIKADCSFTGLSHVLHEPDGRVFIGDCPPLLERVKNNSTKYLRSISVRKRDDASISEHWFDCDIPLNHGLIAIVGNKGSGKSALADIVGLLGSTKNSPSFSFLSAKKFRQPKANKAEHFQAEAVWETGATRQMCLAESAESDDIETINYIPQDYLEGVCNELNSEPDSGFGQALRQVIFSHVDEADRLGFTSLDELLDYRTRETTQSIERQKASLQDCIKRFLKLHEQASPSHRKSIEKQLEAKQAELVANEAVEPKVVPKPENDETIQKQIGEIEGKLADSQRAVEELEGKLSKAEELKAKLSKQIVTSEKLLKRIVNLEATVGEFTNDSASDCELLGLKAEDIIRFEVDSRVVEEKRDLCQKELKTVVDQIGSKDTKGLEREREDAKKAVASLRETLDEPNRRYQEYLSARKKWKQRNDELVGTENTPDTIKYFEHHLRQLDDLPKQVEEVWEQCLAASLLIYDEIKKLADSHRTAFEPVQTFVENHPLAKDRFELRFEAALLALGFSERFLSYITQGRRGSFCGVEEGRERLGDLLASIDFESEAGIRDFLGKIRRSLTFDLRQEPAKEVPIEDQLAKGQSSLGLLSYVLGLEYLSPQVTLRWAGKDIEQLSPGERGTLLLVFYLLIDKSDLPLVIDQPEENLDNQTVVDFLVPSVKEAKDRRQILLVTHNPNLAVVCDADQVICAQLNKNDGHRITYDTGAIENPIINQRIVDILEGTRVAFDNRDGKYHAEKSQARPRHRAFPSTFA